MKHKLKHGLSMLTAFMMAFSLLSYLPQRTVHSAVPDEDKTNLTIDNEHTETLVQDNYDSVNLKPVYYRTDNSNPEAKESENPFNKQDDKEVDYDSSRWVQPKEWNTPTIDPRDYKGGIMLFFDKIGLDPAYAPGKVQRVYFSLTGATEPVGLIKFHIFYDTRLTVRENSAGEVLTVGNAINGFTTGSSMVEEGQLVFYAYSDDTMLSNSSIFTIDFIVPEDAEPGDVYPIGIAYVDDGIAADTFINSKRDDAGKLQMTYVFTKGIYNGYIKVIGEKKTTTTTTSATTTTSSTTTSITTTSVPDDPPELEYTLGDVNNDGTVDGSDATWVLREFGKILGGFGDSFTPQQFAAGDVDKNGVIDGSDATLILMFFGEAGKDIEVSYGGMEAWMEKNFWNQ